MDDYSNLEQLEKRVEWLDNERRGDKTNLASMQNRLTILEQENLNLRKQLKELEVLITKNTSQISALDKYDNRIERLNSDLTKQIREVNDRADMNISEAVKRTKLEIETTRKSITEIYPFTEQLEPLRIELKAQKVEDTRLVRLIEELKTKIQEVGRFDEDYRRSLHLLEENRRQEAKRLTDLQGEVISVRKRLEETRTRFDSFSDSFRALDGRIAELQTYEKDRKEAQSIFIEKVNTSLLDKDKTFKGWEKRFDEIDTINANLKTQLTELENARQVINKSLSSVNEATEKFERRINEISEIQRLNDDRLRQEWTSFKSDDIKRWSNYTLSQEENSHELDQTLASLSKQMQALDNLSFQTREDLDRFSRETVKHIQSILIAYQESIQNIAPILNKKA